MIVIRKISKTFYTASSQRCSQQVLSWQRLSCSAYIYSPVIAGIRKEKKLTTITTDKIKAYFVANPLYFHLKGSRKWRDHIVSVEIRFIIPAKFFLTDLNFSCKSSIELPSN